MANLKFGNTNIGKISIIEPQEIPIVEDSVVSSEEWVRPEHWLDMPTIASGEHKVAILYAVPSGFYAGEDSVTNFYQFNCRGVDDPSTTNSNYFLTDFTVDWGDGTSDHVNQGYGTGGATVNHIYDFSALDPATEFEFRGMRYRQALAVLDAGASGISRVSWRYTTGAHRQNTELMTLEYNANVPSGTWLGSDFDNYPYVQPFLEKARVYAPMVQSLNSFFYMTPRLRSVEIHTTNELIHARGMFNNSAIDYLPEFETSGIQSCDGMFYGVKNIETFPSGHYDFRSVYRNPSNTRWNGFGSMFAFSGFKEVHIDIPQGGPDAGYQNISQMFRSCRNLKKITGNWDTSKCQTWDYSFEHCPNLETMPIPDMSSANNMHVAFRSTPKLRINLFPSGRVYLPYLNYGINAFTFTGGVRDYLYIEDIGTSGAQNNRMDGMFSSCQNLRKVEFSEKPLTTSNINGYQSMFSYCRNLEYVGYFDYAGSKSMNSFFQECNRLKKVAGFNCPDAYLFSNVFKDCHSLEYVPSFDITCGGSGNVNISELFVRCYNLDVPLMDISSVGYGYSAFGGVKSMPSGFQLDFSSNLSSYSTSYNAGRHGYGSYFEELNGLVIPPGANLDSTFSYNYFLKRVPFVEASGAYTLSGLFNYCYNLEWGTLSGVTSNIGYQRTSLGSGAIEDIFNWLGTASATIDIRYTPGSTQLHSDTISIATSKGWTVLT